MAEILTHEMDAKFAPVSERPLNFVSDKSSNDEEILIRPFFVKTQTCTYNDIGVNFGTVRDHGHTYESYCNHYFLTTLLNMELVRSFEVMLEQMLNPCV
jgi:hypothetical protein